MRHGGLRLGIYSFVVTRCIQNRSDTMFIMLDFLTIMLV